MKPPAYVRSILIAAAAAGVLAVSPPTQSSEALSRRLENRSLAATTGSPVDVIEAEALIAQGYTTLPQVLANLVPSFVHPEPALAQGTDHARPSALRGLAPDQMVVLLDGRRRMPAAWLHRADTYGRGSVGVDMGLIPLAAVERVEILRGGASARYGSGAIAGVINVVLKDASAGGSVVATFGQYRTHMKGVPDLLRVRARPPSDFQLIEAGDLNTDDGEGDTLTVAAHGGFELFDAGFIDLTAEFRRQDPTDRSGFDPRPIYPALPGGEFDPREAFADRRTQRYGNPDQEDVKLLTNFGTPIGERTDFYGHIGYTARNAESAGEFVAAGSDANVPAIHPDGYLPLIDSDVESRYFTFGLRGEHWGWRWDLAYTSDEHEMDFALESSLNPSLGAISPTDFEVANYEGRHLIIGLDLARELDLGLAEPVTVRWGVEYLDTEYENEVGDPASIAASGARTDDGRLRPPGSQGFFGVRPPDDFDAPRTNVGAYLQLEAAPTRAVETLAAVRVDDEEEGTEVSGKLGALWHVTDRLDLRGAVSRDYRHPSAAQTYFHATELVAADDGYLEQGTYPADHPVAQALGAETLDTESALNLGIGAEWRFGDAAALSLDLYQIEVDDRVVLSNWLSGPDVTELLAEQGITGVQAVRYLLNGPDTRTRGADLAGRYRWDSRWGPVELGAGWNVSETDVTGSAPVPAGLAGLAGAEPFGERDAAQLEQWTPDSKLILSARWQGERLSLDARLTRYGRVTDLGPVPEQDLDLGEPWLLDLHVRYRLTARGHMGFGVYNLLDEYPEVRSREPSDPVENRVLPYSSYSPFGFNGRFVYLRLGFDLTGG
ncbi:MAG TPA: TonB-dependent receptor [Pseudomonadales bacterium]